MDYNFINKIDYKKLDKSIDILYENIDSIKLVVKEYISEVKNGGKKIKIKDYDKMRKNNTTSTINIVLSLFRVIYNLVNEISIKELHSKKEYKSLKHNIRYKIIVTTSSHKHKLFALFLLMYSIEPYLTKKKYYIGIDYEFYKGKDIRLMQINCERKPKKDDEITSYIWVIKPPDLDEQSHSILIESLMEHKKIYKIMNGADALDTPYMIKELFQENKTTIQNFFATFIDLRYMCEYFKSYWADDNKCDIYSAYLYFDVITEQKHNMLVEGNETVLEVCRSLLWEKSSSDDDIWNINKLDEGILYYVVFDVIYLKYHLLAVIKKSAEKSDFLTGIKMIPFLTRYSIFEKQGLSKVTDELKQYVDPINNYYFYKDNKIFKLVDAYKFFSENLELDDINIDIVKLMKVNYFRNYMMYVLKSIIYTLICHKYQVFISKGLKYQYKYDIDNLYDSISKIGFGKLNILFKSIQQNVDKKLVRIR